jgi:hypothetical protein
VHEGQVVIDPPVCLSGAALSPINHSPRCCCIASRSEGDRTESRFSISFPTVEGLKAAAASCTVRIASSPFEKGPELLDVAFARPSQEVEPVGVVGSDGCTTTAATTRRGSRAAQLSACGPSPE